MRHNALILTLGFALAASACQDNPLPEAIYTNDVDTVSLYALDGTPVSSRSGYNLVSRSAVRTDLTGAFDFAFNIDTLGRALLLPIGALDMGANAGFQSTQSTFADLKLAPGGDYLGEVEHPVVVGDVVAARSRLVSCAGLGALSYYAKIGVLAIDPNERRITFEILTNINCGYRSLEPGRPTQ